MIIVDKYVTTSRDAVIAAHRQIELWYSNRNRFTDVRLKTCGGAGYTLSCFDKKQENIILYFYNVVKEESSDDGESNCVSESSREPALSSRERGYIAEDFERDVEGESRK